MQSAYLELQFAKLNDRVTELEKQVAILKGTPVKTGSHNDVQERHSVANADGALKLVQGTFDTKDLADVTAGLRAETSQRIDPVLMDELSIGDRVILVVYPKGLRMPTGQSLATMVQTVIARTGTAPVLLFGTNKQLDENIRRVYDGTRSLDLSKIHGPFYFWSKSRNEHWLEFMDGEAEKFKKAIGD